MFVDRRDAPHRSQSNRGFVLINQTFRDYLKMIGIEQRFSLAGFPRTNGIVKRAISDTKQRLKRYGAQATESRHIERATRQIDQAVHNVVFVPLSVSRSE